MEKEYGDVMCGSNRHRTSWSDASRSTPSPEPRRDPAAPATDADRQATVDHLRTHTGTGRLDLDEFGERSAVAYAATTIGELDATTADLPSPPPPPVRAPSLGERIGRLERFAPVALLAVVLTTIWAITMPGGYFWPVWPVMAATIHTLKHRHPHRHQHRNRGWGPVRA